MDRLKLVQSSIFVTVIVSSCIRSISNVVDREIKVLEFTNESRQVSHKISRAEVVLVFYFLLVLDQQVNFILVVSALGWPQA